MTQITDTNSVEGRMTRAEQLAALIERDGDECAYCHRDFSQRERTIDHVYPQSRGYEEGWTYEQVWDLTNLVLACKPCNAKKGDRLLDKDGNIPPRKERTFRYRRDKRAQRAEVCDSCNAGRNLGPDEWCNSCGHGPQPGRYPKWRQMSPKDCDHDEFYCVSCTIWFPDQRRSVLDSLVFGNGSASMEDGFIGDSLEAHVANLANKENNGIGQ